MHPVSVLTFGIFLAGYITARWDLVTRLYELTIFAWDRGVVVRYSKAKTARVGVDILQTRAAQGFLVLSTLFVLFLIPIERIAAREAAIVSSGATMCELENTEADKPQHPRPLEAGISAKEQLRRRGSF